MYICVCHAVTEREVEECARAGAQSIDELSMHLGVGTCCGKCRESAADVLRGVHGCAGDVAVAASG